MNPTQFSGGKPRHPGGSFGTVSIFGHENRLYLVPRLYNNNEAYHHARNLYFRNSLDLDQLVNAACGYVSRAFIEVFLGRTPKMLDWPDGLMIGQRKVRVEVVRTGTEPHEYLIDLDQNYVLVHRGRNTMATIVRVIEASVAAMIQWQHATIRRSWRREKSRYDEGMPVKLDSGEPVKKRNARRRRVRPGELLPADEREAVKRESEEALKKIMDDPQPEK